MNNLEAGFVGVSAFLVIFTWLGFWMWYGCRDNKDDGKKFIISLVVAYTPFAFAAGVIIHSIM